MVGTSFSSFPGAQGSYYNPELPETGKGIINTGMSGGDRLRGWASVWDVPHLPSRFPVSISLF